MKKEIKKERIEYIRELRRKFLIIFIFSFIIFILVFWKSKAIINILISYYEIEVYNFSPAESLSISLKFAFFSTLLFLIPATIFQILNFCKESIKKEYRKNFLKKSVFGFILAVIGFVIGSTIFNKMILDGLRSYGIGTSMWSVGSVLNTAIIFGSTIALAFQLIWFIPLIIKIGLIEKKALSKIRIFVFIGLLIISGLISPPNFVSILIMMIPLYGSFEVGLLLSKNKMEVKKC